MVTSSPSSTLNTRLPPPSPYQKVNLIFTPKKSPSTPTKSHRVISHNLSSPVNTPSRPTFNPALTPRHCVQQIDFSSPSTLPSHASAHKAAATAPPVLRPFLQIKIPEAIPPLEKYKGPFGYGSYEGEWKDEQPHGFGKFHSLKDGTVYYGTFHQGKFNGKGKLTYPSGKVYIGHFINNKPHGKGNTEEPNGVFYAGNFYQGDKHGMGTLLAPRFVYQGEWRYDRKHGEGKIEYINGECYIGTWKANLKHGRGTYRFADGKNCEGQWLDDQYQTDLNITVRVNPKLDFSSPNGSLNVPKQRRHMYKSADGKVLVGKKFDHMDLESFERKDKIEKKYGPNSPTSSNSLDYISDIENDPTCV